MLKNKNPKFIHMRRIFTADIATMLGFVEIQVDKAINQPLLTKGF